MENVSAYLYGTAHHLGHTQARWTLPTGKEDFLICLVFVLVELQQLVRCFDV